MQIGTPDTFSHHNFFFTNNKFQTFLHKLIDFFFKCIASSARLEFVAIKQNHQQEAAWGGIERCNKIVF